MGSSKKIINKKKILFFHPYFMNGGIERSNIEIAKLLKKIMKLLSLKFTSHYL